MMLTQAALPLGFKVVVLDPTENSPAAQAGADQIIAKYDKAGLERLAEKSDYLTTEFEEGLDPDLLDHLVKSGAKLNPAPKTIALIADKLEQKNYLTKQGIAMGPYQSIASANSAHELLNKYGDKMVIKTRRGGYDGYGNRVVSSKEEIDQALEDFEDKDLYAEAFVEFEKELAVMVVRSDKGDIVTYPVVETIQANNICHEVLVPAEVGDDIKQAAAAMAHEVAQSFEGAGAFGIEMFLAKDGKVLLNEIAPRVHNSGHYTIEACETSQFENHIRAVTGRLLGPPDLKVPAAVMINILGTYNGESENIDKNQPNPHTYVHIYGKSPNKVGRKMGHITVTADSVAEAQRLAEEARKEIKL